ncbi:hypothetical protein [Streptomyces hyaluromycini]|uniref:hypothetical protein n=1 Tax=Streptomyces hyaluromycini TaxID=1377993 RepID=UPI000B5C2441|nr:hypothetical protein [Streptomyces hyaluromycini]
MRIQAGGLSVGPAEASLVPQVGEFAHLQGGWAVAQPLAGVRLTPGMALVHGAHDEAELDIVAAVVATGHAWAAGDFARIAA